MRSLFNVCVLLLAVLVQGSLGAVIADIDPYYKLDTDECIKSCPDTPADTIQPKVQASYVYALEAVTVLTPRETKSVTINADAVVSIKSRCEALLWLKNVTLGGVEHASELAAQLETYPIGFGYYNGKVREVCHPKSDEIWARNIKKAVISALQLSSTTDGSLDEVDISGKCDTTFYQQPAANEDETVVFKMKDLYRCTDRHVVKPSSPLLYKGVFHQLLNPMSSMLTCKYTLGDRVVRKVECEEGHDLEAFGQTRIHSSTLRLELKQVKPELAAAQYFESNWVHQDISMGLQDETAQVKSTTEDEAVQVLKQLCESVSGKTAHIESSGTFAKLVNLLKNLPDSTTASVYNSIKTGSICPVASKRLRDLFHDASAFAATDSSVVNLANAFNNKELSKSRAAGYFAILALKSVPKNVDTIENLIPLIESKAASRSMLLSISTLIRRYCDQTSDCHTNKVVENAVSKYIEGIERHRSPVEKIAVIKALENLNNVNSEVISNQLTMIIVSDTTEDDVRLAAVQALPVGEDTTDLLRSILLEETYSAEMRIAAFHKWATKRENLQTIDDLYDDLKGYSVRNYIATYLRHLRRVNNPALQALVPSGLSFNYWGNTGYGVSKHILNEMGPLSLERDTIFPENSNITQAASARLRMASKGKIVTIAEVSIRQQGLNKLLGSLIDLFAKKISEAQFKSEFTQDLTELLRKLQSKRNYLSARDQLQIGIKLHDQNVFFADAIEDLAVFMEMATRVQELASVQSKDDSIFGAVLFENLDFTVPTATGIPLHYKLNLNALSQSNGQVNRQTNKTHFIMNRSLVAGISTSVRLQLADQKVGYEYNGKLALTPNFDLEFEQNDKSVMSIKWNLKEDKHVFLKMTQSAKELKQIGAGDQKEVEFVPEFRKDICFPVMILNYCRKASQVSTPYAEYYITKPESAISALKFDLEVDTDNPMSQSVTLKVNALGTATNYEHSAQLQYINLFGIIRKAVLKLQSPQGSFETKASISLGSGSSLNVNLDTANFKLNGNMAKERDNAKNDLLVQYKLPNSYSSMMHFVKFQNSYAVDTDSRRGPFVSAGNVNFTWLLESSQLPWLNHRSLGSVQTKVNKLLGDAKTRTVLEFAYGPEMDRLLKFENNMEGYTKAGETKTVVSAKEDRRYIATDLGINYGFKANTRVNVEKGESMDLTYNVTGIDYSKRPEGDDRFHSQVHLQNKGESVDSKLDANLAVIGGEDYEFHGEFKRVQPRKYEGKFSLEW